MIYSAIAGVCDSLIELVKDERFTPQEQAEIQAQMAKVRLEAFKLEAEMDRRRMELMSRGGPFRSWARPAIIWVGLGLIVAQAIVNHPFPVPASFWPSWEVLAGGYVVFRHLEKSRAGRAPEGFASFPKVPGSSHIFEDKE